MLVELDATALIDEEDVTDQENVTDYPENEWLPGPDGIVERTAARVVLLDPDGRLFLIRGHDTADPNHAWWFTVGGGIAPGEDPKQGAVRELFEETGLEVTPDRLIGPVLRRTGLFHFIDRTRRQYEKFFVLHVSEAEAEQVSSWNQDHLTDLEKDVLDEVRWWELDELIALQENGTKVFPRGIGEMAREWFAGWDGTLKIIEES